MIGVGIVSFNTKDLLKNCLQDLQKQNIKSEIWVLDNNSSDNSAEMVKKDFPKVHLMVEEENLGFAKGQNKILKKLGTEYVLILNPDTKFPAYALEKMLSFMENNPRCGIASGKIFGFDGKLHSNGGDLPFNFSLFNWLFNLEIFGIRKNMHRQDEKYYEYSHEVGWVGGTFMFVRSEVFQKIGFLSEDYFMYFEDTEFCFRAKKAGFVVMVNPEVEIQHASGASSEDPRFRQWSGEFWGLVHFYSKQFGKIQGGFVRILVYLAILLRIGAFALVGKIGFSKTYAKILFTL